MRINTVPWYGKNYTEIVEKGMIEDVKTHIRTNLTDEQQIDYIKYLRHLCAFPQDFKV